MEVKGTVGRNGVDYKVQIDAIAALKSAPILSTYPLSIHGAAPVTLQSIHLSVPLFLDLRKIVYVRQTYLGCLALVLGFLRLSDKWSIRRRCQASMRASLWIQYGHV